VSASPLCFTLNCRVLMWAENAPSRPEGERGGGPARGPTVRYAVVVVTVDVELARARSRGTEAPSVTACAARTKPGARAPSLRTWSVPPVEAADSGAAAGGAAIAARSSPWGQRSV
jgi:hypothetical protein